MVLDEVSRIADRFDAQDAALIRYAADLALRSGEMTSQQVDTLRELGFSDREVHDIVMVSACFAFMNRLADGTGVALQADRYPLARELFGDHALTKHLRWAGVSI